MLVDGFFVEVLEFFFYQKIHPYLKLLFCKYINFTLKIVSEGPFRRTPRETNNAPLPKKYPAKNKGF